METNQQDKRDSYLILGTWAKTYNGNCGGKLLLYRKEEEQMKLLQSVDTGKSVSAQAWDAGRKLLFVLCETNYHREKEAGGEIRIYRLTEDHRMELMEIQNSYGGFPIGIALTDKYVMVLNHGSNLANVCRTYRDAGGRVVTEFSGDEASLCLFQRTADGKIGDLVDQYLFHGHGQIPFFQDSPAPHELYFWKEQELYAVPMRGTDETRIFRIDETKDRIVFLQSFRQREKTGPRNAVINVSEQDTDKKILYVLSEIEPLLTVFRKKENDWEEIQELTVTDNIPPDLPCTSFDYPHPSGLLLHPERQKLYAITRTENILTAFQVLPDGMLEKKQEWKLKGTNPRQILLWEEKLFVVCMDSQNVWEIALDPQGFPVGERQIISRVERVSCMQLIS